MPKIRSIKPESCQSPTLARLSDRACLLFAYLPCFCDDWGVMPYHPAKIKALVFPLRPYTVDECEALVGELAGAGVVRVFEAEGRSWLHVVNFCEHQKPNRRYRSEYPLPPDMPAQCGGSGGDVPEHCADSAPAVRGACAGSAATGEDARVAGEVASASPGKTPSETARAVRQQCGRSPVNGKGEGKRKEKREKEKRAAEPPTAQPSPAQPPSPEPPPFDAAEPSDEDVRRVVSCINRVAGKRLSADTPSVRGPIAVRLAQGRSVDDLCAVAACKAREWRGWEQAKARLVPKTLFGRRFDEYLDDARAGGGGTDDEDERYSGAW